jgi:hypothetical protein
MNVQLTGYSLEAKGAAVKRAEIDGFRRCEASWLL